MDGRQHRTYHRGVGVEDSVADVDHGPLVARVGYVSAQVAEQGQQAGGVASAEGRPQPSPLGQLLKHARHHLGPAGVQGSVQGVAVVEAAQQLVVGSQLHLQRAN
eukprot:scaffold462433_cov44-Prasinocladus_malaysianus.AAC.1